MKKNNKNMIINNLRKSVFHTLAAIPLRGYSLLSQAMNYIPITALAIYMLISQNSINNMNEREPDQVSTDIKIDKKHTKY